MKRFVAALSLILGCGAGVAERPEMSPTEAYDRTKQSVVVVTCTDKKKGGGGVLILPRVVLTNFHVVSGCQEMEILAWSGDSEITNKALLDAKGDLAQVLLDRPLVGTFPASWSMEIPRVGERVFYVSHPNGNFWSMSQGYVMHDGVRTGVFSGERDLGVLQIDATTYSGSSGGGLFDRIGRLVGIGTGRVGDTGISYAIPLSSMCKRLVQCNAG